MKICTPEIYATRVDITKHHITHGTQETKIANHEWYTRETTHMQDNSIIITTKSKHELIGKQYKSRIPSTYKIQLASQKY